MENRLAIDTDILVEFLRGDEDTIRYFEIKEKESILATTCINAFELHIGAQKSSKKKHNTSKVQELLRRLTILPLSLEAAQKAAEINSELEKKGKIVDFKDLLIAAMTMQEGYTLKTNNIKHFARIRGLKLS